MMKDKKLTSEEAMSLAIKEAKKGLGFVSPNPPVGAVILDKNGICIAQGYHKKHGADHAEIMAIKAVSNKKQLEGASLYVTLEPCAHQGLTPPCIDQIINLPLAQVCMGLKDPNPLVCGKSLQKLKKSKIKTELYKGPQEESLKELIEVFSHNITYKRPFTAVKIASSLDGKISIPNRKWITGPDSRNYVSWLRGCYDAVCIGAGTLKADNPRLNPRHSDFLHKENTVIILNPSGSCLPQIQNFKVSQVRDPKKVIVVTAPLKSKSKHLHNCSILEHKTNKDGLFEWDHLCKSFFEKGLNSILIEGGGVTFSSLLPYAQRLYLFLAPVLAGEHSQKAVCHWTAGGGFPSAQSLSWVQTKSFGPDTLITGRLQGF